MADPAGFVDYYSQCESALKDFFQANLADYLPNDWQITDDESDLIRGADYYILLRPGSKPDTPISFQSGAFTTLDWRINCNLFVRYIYGSQKWPTFKKFRAVVWYVLEKNQFVQNNANVERVISYGFPEEPFYWKFKGTPEDAQPNMMAQPLFVVVRQRVIHTT